MKFFFDNNMSPLLTRALREMEREEQITHLRELFKEDTNDIDWLNELGKQGDWIIISGDLKISRRPHERKAWLDSNLPTLFMVDHWARVQKWEQAWLFFRWWPDLKFEASRLKLGQAIQVHRSANFKCSPLK